MSGFNGTGGTGVMSKTSLSSGLAKAWLKHALDNRCLEVSFFLNVPSFAIGIVQAHARYPLLVAQTGAL